MESLIILSNDIYTYKKLVYFNIFICQVLYAHDSMIFNHFFQFEEQKPFISLNLTQIR